MIYFKNGKLAIFAFLGFQLKLQFFKSSNSVVSENSHVLLENIVPRYFSFEI